MSQRSTRSRRSDDETMATADEYKILDDKGLAVPPMQTLVAAAAANRAIVCLQELRRASSDDSLERLKKVEAEADHIIVSAGLSL